LLAGTRVSEWMIKRRWYGIAKLNDEQRWNGKKKEKWVMNIDENERRKLKGGVQKNGERETMCERKTQYILLLSTSILNFLYF
jgi:hypothetical protein